MSRENDQLLLDLPLPPITDDQATAATAYVTRRAGDNAAEVLAMLGLGGAG